MTNVVLKLTNQEIQQLMSKIQFDTSNVSQGMKGKTKYKSTSISIYNSNKVMFQGKDADNIASQLLPNTAKPAQSKTNSVKKLLALIRLFDITIINVLVVMKQAVAIISVHLLYVLLMFPKRMYKY